MLFLFEYRGAKLLISDQFPDTAGEITSFRVESDVVSLNGREPLQADAEIGADGKLHVVVRRSTTASSSMLSSYYGGNKSNINSITSITPRISNLTGVEIYSIQSSREPTPRASSFNQSDFYKLFASKASSPARNGIEVFSVQGTPRFGRSMSGEFGGGGSRYPTPNLMISGSGNGRKGGGGGGAVENGDEKDANMFVWSSSESPGSEDHGNVRHGGHRGGGGRGSSGFAAVDASKAVLQHEIDAARGMHDFVGSPSPARKVTNGEKEVEIREVPKFSTQSPHTKKKKQVDLEGDVDRRQHMPPASVMTRLILIMVWRKLIRNPNTYSSLFGLAWSLISFRWNIEMPTIVKGSISILSDAGLGMAMFSLGLFMALQPKLIACGKTVATFAMAVRFLTGPAVIAATSIAIGLRGVLLHVAIVQAALPQGIVPFVFAKEYNVHPDILSTGVIFGMLIALPITILYYVLLGI
ncbi:Auxin efflux carrier component 2-like protein [Drosera capensis]